MKFPSVTYLSDQVFTSLKRFYLPLLFAALGTYASVMLIRETKHPIFLGRLFYSCIIGLPLSLGCFLWAERRGSKYLKLILSPVILSLIVAYSKWLAPENETHNYRQWLIFFILAIVMHLWVAVAAYLRKNEQIGFWRFNEALFTRIIIAGLYSGVLFAGLALALFALDELLGLKFNDRAYPELWCIIAGMFNTWFFLSGVPDDYTVLDNVVSFPKWLKVFTQYILLPLVIIYSTILYVYGVKIMVQHHLPKGWVSVLIIGYAITGILALLLVEPIRNDAENKWVKLFSRFFYVALFPLIALLYVAAFARIHLYGITEERYYILALGIWLVGIAIYFIFSRKKNIKAIPVSLGIVALLSIIGPWNVFHVSANNQYHRLTDLLAKNHISQQTTQISNKISSDDREQVEAIVEYMIDRHYLTTLQPLYSTDISALYERIRKHEWATQGSYGRNNSYESFDGWSVNRKMKDTLTGLLHISHDISDDDVPTNNEFASAQSDVYDISGYKQMINMNCDYNGDTAYVFSLDHKEYTLSLNTWNGILTIESKGHVVVAQNDLHQLANRLTADSFLKNDSIPNDSLILFMSGGNIDSKIIISRFRVYTGKHKDTKYIENIWAKVLVK